MGKKMGWGIGEGQSLSVFDHIVGKPIIHGLLHGQSYQGEYDKIGKGLSDIHGANQAWLTKALRASQMGYGDAQNALGMQGALGTKAILDREKQALAGNDQSMISRGLYSTTAANAGARGITQDTNDSLASLNAQLATIGSNIKINEGQALAGAYGNFASENQNYANQYLNLGLNTQYGEQGGMANLVAGIFGSLSDRRLKTNIEMIGIADGIPIYEYDFVPETGIEGRWRGVLADEVEHLPGVVTVGKDGYKRVDYGLLGFKMARVPKAEVK
jgi:hypothetical protein